MKYSLTNPRFLTLASMVLTAALMRLLPHWPNFTPIAAMALFAGTFFDKKYFAFIVPFAAMFLSDLIIGLHANMLAVYLSFAITVVIGMVIRNKVSVGSVVLASFSSSVIFFLVTNFSMWVGSVIYPQNFTGLLECYTAGLLFFNDSSYGISFFMNDMIATLFYSGLLYGAWYLAALRFPVLKKS